MNVVLEQAGIAAVTDLGRQQTAFLGVQTNGAADQFSARGANILAANPESHPLLEVTAVMPVRFRVDAPSLLAVTGAARTVLVDGAPMPTHRPTFVPAGARVEVPASQAGLRSYVAFHGRIEATPFLGSYTFDPLIGTSTQLADGQTLHVTGACLGTAPTWPYLPLPLAPLPLERPTRIGILPGPEVAEFPAFMSTAASVELTVADQSDHVGLRLFGHEFERTTDTEILSRGVPVGTVEIPPSGEVIILLRGRPLTAGYPIAAVVGRGWHDELGQLRPGATVLLTPCTQAESLARAQHKHEVLAELARRCERALRDFRGAK